MDEANFDKRQYFGRIGHQLPPRTKAEAVIQLPCFFHGAFAVVGDSVSEEIAKRVAVLRGSRVTHNASRACSSSDVYYRGMNTMDFWWSVKTHIPCHVQWVWLGVGLHHLYRRPSVVFDDSCHVYRHRVNKSDWDSFQTGYERFTPPSIVVRDAVYHSFPKCWHEFGRASASSKRFASSSVTLISMMPPDPLVMLAHPAKFDWTAFFDLGLAEVWLAAQRRLVNETSAFDFLDLGPLVSANPGARCDGIHFGSTLGETSWSSQGPRRRVLEWCHSKVAAYDAAILEWSFRQRCA